MTELSDIEWLRNAAEEFLYDERPPPAKRCKRIADALGQKDVVIADLMESLDEAKYDEPELRSKLDKLRGELKIKSEFLSSRQCPDHSGKWQRGDCLQCRIERLEADLSLCALRLENCIVASGTDREFAEQAVAKYRRLIAGGSEPKEDEPCPECHGTRKTVINKHIGVEDCPVCAQTDGDTLPIRDASCLDSGCNEGEAHKPWCDHAQTVPNTEPE